MQVHLHLAIAHQGCTLLEYIPWLRECFEEPASVREGWFAMPEAPGAGTTIRLTALERLQPKSGMKMRVLRAYPGGGTR